MSRLETGSSVHVSHWITVGKDGGLLSIQHQAIILSNADLLTIRTHEYSLRRHHLKCLYSWFKYMLDIKVSK